MWKMLGLGFAQLFLIMKLCWCIPSLPVSGHCFYSHFVLDHRRDWTSAFAEAFAGLVLWKMPVKHCGESLCRNIYWPSENGQDEAIYRSPFLWILAIIYYKVVVVFCLSISTWFWTHDLVGCGEQNKKQKTLPGKQSGWFGPILTIFSNQFVTFSESIGTSKSTLIIAKLFKETKCHKEKPIFNIWQDWPLKEIGCISEESVEEPTHDKHLASMVIEQINNPT